MADKKNEEAQKDDCKQNEDERPKLTPAEERAAYFKKLEKWLCDAYAWQHVATMFPYYVMSGQITNSASGVSFPSQVSTVTTTQVIIVNNDQQNDALRLTRVQDPVLRRLHQLQTPGQANRGFEYRIPPMWKRLAAELVDLTLLFLMKVCITFMLIDVSNFIHINEVDSLQINLRINYKMAAEMTYELLAVEIIYRVIVCIFEAFWIQHGAYGLIGGATPGKFMMGLRVVQCRSVTPVERPDEPDLVRVTPGTDLGLPLALTRSVMKNLIMAFLFPVCFALFFFRFNRTSYDLICHSIVVECPYVNAINNNNRAHQQ